MKRKKNILLAYHSAEMAKTLAEFVKEFADEVLIVNPENELQLSVREIKKLHCCIIDCNLPEGKGIRFIEEIVRNNKRSKIIAVVDRITRPVRLRMRLLGVYSILEHPLKRNLFVETVRQLVLGNDVSSNKKGMSSIVHEVDSTHYTVLLAHKDPVFYELVRNLWMTEGHDVYGVTNPEDFIAASRQGYFTIVFSSESFLDAVSAKVDLGKLFHDRLKPILLLTSDHMHTKVRNSYSQFQFVVSLGHSPSGPEIVEALQEVIPKHEQYVKSMTSSGMNETGRTSNIGLWINRIQNKIRGIRLAYYLVLLLIVIIMGFLVSMIVFWKDESIIDQNSSRSLIGQLPDDKKIQFDRIMGNQDR